LTGLHRCRGGEYGVEEMIGDAAVGVQEGYIVVLGMAKEQASGKPAVRLFVRFGAVNAGAVTAAMKNCQTKFAEEGLTYEADSIAPIEEDAVSSGAASRGDSPAKEQDSARKDDGEIGDPRDSLAWTWIYKARKPDPQRVVTLLKACLDSLKEIAPPFPPTCEICKKSSVSEITLRDGMPGYYCDGCQEIRTRAFKEKLREYESRPVNHQKGLAYGLISAILTGLAAGYLASLFLPRISGAAAFWIAALTSGFVVTPIYEATEAGLGGIDDKGINIIVAMAMLGMFVAHVFFYIFWAYKLGSETLGLWTLSTGLELFMESPGFHVLALLVCLFFAVFAVIQGGLRHEVPRPDETFEPLDVRDAEEDSRSE
jgi:hypothetical protein